MARSPFIPALVLGALAPGAIGSVIRDDATEATALALAGQPAFTGAARFSILGGVGSGTLVAPGWVLTAAHVVTDSTGSLLPLGSITVTVNGETRGVAGVTPHPGWTGGNYTAGVDLALVRLSSPVDAVAAQRSNGAAPLGETATLTGYGAFGFGSFGLISPPGTLRAVTNTLDALAPAFFPSWSPSLVLMDFDAPATTLYNRFGGGVATNAEGSPATGDSGGGSFVLSGGDWLLMGVHSFTFTTPEGAAAPFGYGTGAADVLVADHAAWIDSVILPTPGAAGPLAGAALLAARRRSRA